MKERITIWLGDDSDFVAGPSIASLMAQRAGEGFDLVDLQAAETLAANLRRAAFQAWLERLADELNGQIADFETRLVHQDTIKFLEFVGSFTDIDAEDE